MVNSLLVSGHYLGEMIEKLHVDFGGAKLGDFASKSRFFRL